jgi:hypothetical protein
MANILRLNNPAAEMKRLLSNTNVGGIRFTSYDCIRIIPALAAKS